MLGLCPIITMRWKFKKLFPNEKINKNDEEFTQAYIDWLEGKKVKQLEIEF